MVDELRGFKTSITWLSDIKRGVGHHLMDSTRQSSSTVRVSRGISARACTAKTMLWRLDSAKGALARDASIDKVSLRRVMWETQENHQVNENHKKRLE